MDLRRALPDVECDDELAIHLPLLYHHLLLFVRHVELSIR
jgi:hypothetical protein